MKKYLKKALIFMIISSIAMQNSFAIENADVFKDNQAKIADQFANYILRMDIGKSLFDIQTTLMQNQLVQSNSNSDANKIFNDKLNSILSLRNQLAKKLDTLESHDLKDYQVLKADLRKIFEEYMLLAQSHYKIGWMVEDMVAQKHQVSAAIENILQRQKSLCQQGRSDKKFLEQNNPFLQFRPADFQCGMNLQLEKSYSNDPQVNGSSNSKGALSCNYSDDITSVKETAEFSQILGPALLSSTSSAGTYAAIMGTAGIAVVAVGAVAMTWMAVHGLEKSNEESKKFAEYQMMIAQNIALDDAVNQRYRELCSDKLSQLNKFIEQIRQFENQPETIDIFLSQQVDSQDPFKNSLIQLAKVLKFQNQSLANLIKDPVWESIHRRQKIIFSNILAAINVLSTRSEIALKGKDKEDWDNLEKALSLYQQIQKITVQMYLGRIPVSAWKIQYQKLCKEMDQEIERLDDLALPNVDVSGAYDDLRELIKKDKSLL